MSLLIVGSIGIDTVETPYAKSGAIAGGAGIYAAWSASNFVKKNIYLTSIIGDDFMPEEIEGLKARNVNWENVKTIKEGKTFQWEGRYHEDMNSRDTLKTELNTLAGFQPELKGESHTADFVLLANLSPAVQLSALDQLSEKPCLIGLDTMNFWMDNTMDELQKAISRIDLLFLNDSEALQLGKSTNLKKAIQNIQQMGPQYLCVKRGEHGAVLISGDRIFMCPAFLLETVFDPTGAGDSFAGGMMGYLASGDSKSISFGALQRAVLMGTVTASYCVESFGTQKLKQAKTEEIQNRFFDLQRMMFLEEEK